MVRLMNNFIPYLPIMRKMNYTNAFGNKHAIMRGNMAILITGGAGYIGSHTVYAFLEAGHALVVLDDLSTGYRDLLPQDIAFYNGNVGDEQILDQIFGAHAIECVIHFAGSISVPESVSDPLKYYKNNVANTAVLLESCVKHSIKNFIFSSTASVYGDCDAPLLDEILPPAPKNPYARTKLIIEDMIQDAAISHNFNYTILRYFNVAGADPHGRTGQISRVSSHLIKIACEVITGKREQISIFGSDYPTPDGTCLRDYIHVSDLADAHLCTYGFLIKNGGGHLFNCGYGKGYSVKEVLAMVEHVSGINLKTNITARRTGDPHTLVANTARLREKTGWTPRHNNLEQIVASALDWEKHLAAHPHNGN